MIRHLFKLLWNRKRASALIVVEIVISFVVLTFVIGAFAHFAINWNRPLGYDASNVWVLDVGVPPGDRTAKAAETRERFALILREINGMPDVISASGVDLPPYTVGESTTEFEERRYWVNQVNDGFAETLDLEVTRGRWFGPEDDGVEWRPVVLNEEAVRLYFGSEDPIGMVLNPNSERRPYKVVGVITDYRKGGELQSSKPYCFVRNDLSDDSTIAPDNIAVRTSPGADTAFEVALLDRARLVAPDWTFDVRPISIMRRGALKLQFAPLIAGAVIAGSMILLVALGLTGVIWQNVTRRTQEIGLRRAVGASSSIVQRQILTETLIIAAFGLAGGLLLVLQAPLLGVEVSVDRAELQSVVFASGVGGASIMILTIVTLCALYPSRLASSIEPAEALHYE